MCKRNPKLEFLCVVRSKSGLHKTQKSFGFKGYFYGSKQTKSQVFECERKSK